MKTIAFLNIAYPCGGAESVTGNLASFLRSRGYRILLYSPVFVDEILTDRDRDTFEFRLLPRKVIRENIDYLCESLLQEQVNCLIVQVTTNIPFAQLRQRVGCKIILCVHSKPLWEVDYARNLSLANFPNASIGKKAEFLLLRQPINLLTSKHKRRTLKLYSGILPHIDRLQMLCPEYHEQMERLIRTSGYPGSDVPPEKFGSIANPLLPPVEPVRGTPKEKIVLYVGRLDRTDKRIDRLLRIWSKIERAGHTGWKLLLVGTGAHKDNLMQLAKKLDLQHVEFAGFHTDMAPLYRKASFICLTSNFEGLPMSLIEAQQYGVIPVTFDSFGAARQIVCDGEAGLIIPAFKLQRYADVLGQTLEDVERQERLRANCYEAAKQYDLEKIGNQWLQLFDTL